ncbi:type II toxin-antitoxin system VapC family toxin [Mesorhizobium sp. ANAO-SY3R2]|uniref:type II toxin-antitoxin system VapC family toxin n=1 Tax=Mesorhizobium sp. ANAO-SY3R2 TaxID=3166644 RepID=UPI00366F85CD
MKVTPDTNVLVRIAVMDDDIQTAAALQALDKAEIIAVPLTTLCEFVWVLRQSYKRPAADVAASLQGLLASSIVETNRPAAEAGIAMLLAGGDFADGVIAFEGAQAGGTTFVTFDRKAAALVKKLGGEAAIPT